MNHECCNNKPLISYKELTIPANPAVLKDPLMSNHNDKVNLHSHYLAITQFILSHPRLLAVDSFILLRFRRQS